MSDPALTLVAKAAKLAPMPFGEQGRVLVDFRDLLRASSPWTVFFMSFLSHLALD